MSKRRAKTSLCAEGRLAFTAEETAQLLGYTPDFVRKLVERGALRAFQASERTLRITRKAIDDFIERHTLPTAREVRA